jgi:Protein of unknown function (DUF3224)
MTLASGPFEVRLTSEREGDPEKGVTLGRVSIDKQFSGDLEATSRGEMLTAMSEVEGSAGYVAIELVSGRLHGRSGTFVLQHSGTMARGAQSLSVTVVPDSGTDQLVGITGKMAINIDEDGKHSYDFEYTLGESP